MRAALEQGRCSCALWGCFSQSPLQELFLCWGERAKGRLAVNGSDFGSSGVIITDTWPVLFYLVSWQGWLK